MSMVKGRLIATGGTAEVYAWRDHQVLKLFYDWVPEAWIRREWENGRALSATSLPTPRLFERVSLEGRPGIVFERVAGPSMLQLLTAQPWRLVSLARQFAELHSMIHAQSGTVFASSRVGLVATITQAESLPAQSKDEVLDLLNNLPDGTALCHFDYHPDQVMLTPRGPVILDWMSARQGSPLADVAKTLILVTFGRAPNVNRLMQILINLFRGALGRSYLSRYLELHPQVTKGQVEAWMVPMAAARLVENVPGEHPFLLEYLARSLR